MDYRIVVVFINPDRLAILNTYFKGFPEYFFYIWLGGDPIYNTLNFRCLKTFSNGTASIRYQNYSYNNDYPNVVHDYPTFISDKI